MTILLAAAGQGDKGRLVIIVLEEDLSAGRNAFLYWTLSTA